MGAYYDDDVGKGVMRVFLVWGGVINGLQATQFNGTRHCTVCRLVWSKLSSPVVEARVPKLHKQITSMKAQPIGFISTKPNLT